MRCLAPRAHRPILHVSRVCAAQAGHDRADRTMLRRHLSRTAWRAMKASQPWQKTRRRGRPPRRAGHNLLLRLSTRRLDVLRFLKADPAAPSPTILAERMERMMKLRQKISGGFRSGVAQKTSPSSARFSQPPESRVAVMLQTLTSNPTRPVGRRSWLWQAGSPT